MKKNRLVLAVSLFMALASFLYSCRNENGHPSENINASLSPDDQIKFEKKDQEIYKEMCATKNSFKLNEIENQLSKYRSSIGFVRNWYFVIESVHQGVIDENLKYNKNQFIIDAKSEGGMACSIYIDPNDNVSNEIAKQTDNGQGVHFCGDFAWSGMVGGFTLKNAKIIK